MPIVNGKQQAQVDADSAGPTGRRRARQEQGNWTTRPVTITLLHSEESVHTEVERLQVLRKSLHDEIAKADEVAREARFVIVRVCVQHRPRLSLMLTSQLRC